MTYRRSIDVRKGHADIEDLTEPYYYYDKKTEPNQLPGCPKRTSGGFPDNVKEYLWTHEGINDNTPWYALCELKNGLYAFFKASCTYTGFCIEEMSEFDLYIGTYPEIIILAMSDADYDLYILETNPDPFQINIAGLSV